LKKYLKKLAKFSQILETLNNIFKPTLVHKSSRIIVYNALALPILLYGSTHWTLRQKDKKRLTSIEMKFFRRTVGYTLFDHKRNIGRGESRTSSRETKKTQFKLATTSNKNEQQQDAKNNAEL
jgi:hypothetical protein